jgi:DNA-binding response OmpR family regulator
MSRILVIEDDPAILEGLEENLRFEGYEVLTASDGETGYARVRDFNPDLILLDLMLPAMSGLDVCRKVRDDGCRMPILMVTARSEEADRIGGLDMGADDYVTKPFSLGELMARVRALLRRAEPPELPVRLTFNDVEVDFRRYAATRGGSPVDMTRKEFAVLRYLAARAGEVVTRDELLNEVWGYESFPVSRTVDNHIAALRSKLDGPDARTGHIRTVHGVGYRFDLPTVS